MREYQALNIASDSKVDNAGVQKWRMVVDYQKLNEITIPDPYPLPNIGMIFDQCEGAVYFTVIDLYSGFFHVRIHPEDIHQLAFSTDSGHYKYKKTSFGIMNGPSTFQREMDRAMRGLVGNGVFVFIDNVIIYSKTLE